MFLCDFTAYSFDWRLLPNCLTSHFILIYLFLRAAQCTWFLHLVHCTKEYKVQNNKHVQGHTAGNSTLLPLLLSINNEVYCHMICLFTHNEKKSTPKLVLKWSGMTFKRSWDFERKSIFQAPWKGNWEQGDGWRN